MNTMLLASRFRSWSTSTGSYPILGIVCVAALFRVSFPGLYEFRHDSAYWALEARRILVGGYWPLVGQQVGSVSVELYNGPLLSYLTSVAFLAFGYRPDVMALWVGIMNVCGILATWRLGHMLGGRQCGLTAATLMACAPWLVLFGRMLWPQSLLPLLIPATMFLLISGRASGSTLRFVTAGILLGLGVQLHLSVLAVLAAGALWPVLTSTRGFVYGGAVLVGAGLGYLPILLYDLQHQFSTARTLLQMNSLHRSPDAFLVHVLKVVWQFTNVLSGQGLWFSKIALRSAYLPAPVDWGQGIIGSLWFAAAGVQAARGWWRERHSPSPLAAAYLLMLLILALPLAQLTLGRGEVQRHYFITIFPVPFLLMSLAVDRWRAQRPCRFAPYPTVVAFVALNIVTVGAAWRYLETTGGDSGVGVVVADKQAAAAFITNHARDAFVDLRGAQESLPYVFLFSAGVPLPPPEPSAGYTNMSWGDGRKAGRYRIVERRYHPLLLEPGESVLFERRGVAVVQQTAN
jgi:4-amino-4-deoxy-L-arabinose transferase-like glycosyltransferase